MAGHSPVILAVGAPGPSHSVKIGVTARRRGTGAAARDVFVSGRTGMHAARLTAERVYPRSAQAILFAVEGSARLWTTTETAFVPAVKAATA